MASGPSIITAHRVSSAGAIRVCLLEATLCAGRNIAAFHVGSHRVVVTASDEEARALLAKLTLEMLRNSAPNE